jgi:hypothetical protein
MTAEKERHSIIPPTVESPMNKRSEGSERQKRNEKRQKREMHCPEGVIGLIAINLLQEPDERLEC